MAQTTYSRRLRKATWLAFGVPIALALPAGFLMRGVNPGEDFWPVLIGGLAIFTVAFWACLPWWRTMDDMQRHGQMISWYWGGLAGGVIALVWLFAALGFDSDQARGAIVLCVGQTIGFGLFWAVWMWRQQRGAGE